MIILLPKIKGMMASKESQQMSGKKLSFDARVERVFHYFYFACIVSGIAVYLAVRYELF